jgi:serine/threonine protein kinase
VNVELGMKSYEGTLGKYELQERLGAGGNGEVWRATGPQGVVALKILKKARMALPDARPRFSREIAALRMLTGVRGVLPLLDASPDQAGALEHWFAMPLATLMRKRLGPDSSLKNVCEAHAALAAALERVHDRRISHRDIKPDNLYWFDDQWCLGDFGLADFPDAEQLTESGKKLGPAFYIAPEMLNDAANADGTKADIYSLGKTLWVIATGQTYPMPGVHDPAFAGGAIATYCDDPRSSLLDELVRRMTFLDPGERPLAGTIAHELGLLAQDQKIDNPPNPDSSLKRLRAALVPHFTRQQEEARQSALAGAIVENVRQAIHDVVQAIKVQTGLEPENWYSLPNYWGYHAHLCGPTIEIDDSWGYSFEAGGDVHTWKLSIGLKHQLLSDGTLALHIGYQLDRLIMGSEANTMGMPRGWEDHGLAANGTPSASELADRLIAGLKLNLPEVLNRYAELVEQASK